MKNLITLFLLIPLFSNAQYGLRDCHTDLVLGYDYGTPIFLIGENTNGEFPNINSFRIGMNVTYPISDRSYLVSGIRISTQLMDEKRVSFFENGAEGQKILSPKSQTYFTEVPFNFRYLVKNLGRDSRIYIEGGLQFNFYVFSFLTENAIDENGKSFEEKMLERSGRFNDLSISSQLSVGWEYDFSEKLKYFVQPVGRFQLLAQRRDFDYHSYHVGLETGIRF